MLSIRDAAADESARLANIWHDAWHDAHADIVPPELVRFRTLESFERRLRAMIADVRVALSDGQPAGFCVAKGDELYQLFVASWARGTGVAGELVADAESRLAAQGVETAWLACAVGNDRAARFYEKCGWRRVGTMINNAETDRGVFPLETWRYEKVLSTAARPNSTA